MRIYKGGLDVFHDPGGPWPHAATQHVYRIKRASWLDACSAARSIPMLAGRKVRPAGDHPGLLTFQLELWHLRNAYYRPPAGYPYPYPTEDVTP